MTESMFATSPYPFPLEATSSTNDEELLTHAKLPNCRGRIPSLQASRLRALMQEAFLSSKKIIALPCTCDALTSKLVEEAGFPAVFLSGFPVAGSLALPDTGYISLGEMTQKIQETARQVTVPILADGDTGYGSPMNMRRTVQAFALAGAAGIMIEDQTWPKRCGHAAGKAVVEEDEAYARVQAAVDSRNEGMDIWIMGRTDSLIRGYDTALRRARKFIEIGVDCIFVEALPDLKMMERLVADLQFPCMAAIIPGGRTENTSAATLAGLGFSCVAYPFSVIAAKIKAVREMLEELKASFLRGKAPDILQASEVFEAVGFSDYYKLEDRYQFQASRSGKNGYQWS
jgi:2-methylisocitrate lyase-like PEP mutase family enzyme